jgi:taurine dioxygenase
VFGELELHPLESHRGKDHQELTPFGNEEKMGGGMIVNGEHLAGFIYAHQDMAFTPLLSKGSILRLVQLPDRGGDTRFWDTAKIYRALPEATKKRLEGLSAIHKLRAIPPIRAWGMPGFEAEPADMAQELERGIPREWPLVLHPMVITHPDSGLKSVLLNPVGYVRIEGMEQAESDALFDELCRFAFQPEFEYRHRWRLHDMVLWDNRRSMHMATGYPFGQARLAVRATFTGAQEVGRHYVPPDGKAMESVFTY